MSQDPALAAFCRTFNFLDKTCTEKLYELYTDDIAFTDPVHHVEGVEALLTYFNELYNNVDSCQFEFPHAQRQGSTAFAVWTMTLRHPRLDRGAPIRVDGCSHLIFSETQPDKVCVHRDYFDAGAMLYERLPLLGTVIRRIKRHVAA
ncbi:nuclear transport factor 2 family protein [Halomonas sp. V046]|uniref:nuclear transport factor 2 family protein n=1 Tax=Halomonas sp. V046 TaxID=3459611 RepID=UPI0040447A83